MKELNRASELRNCSQIRVVLMLLVVLYHSMAIFIRGGWGPYQPSQDAPVLGYIAEWLNSFHVYGFTLISGYVFYYIKYERGAYQEYLAFLHNKSKRLLVPYVFVASVWVVPVYAYFYGTDDILDKFVLGKSPSQLWFLLMLFWVSAIFWLLSDAVDEKPTLTGAIMLVCYCFSMFIPGYFCLNIGVRNLVFFYIGFVIRKSDIVRAIIYRMPSMLYLIVDAGLFLCTEYLKDFEDILFKACNMGLGVLLHMIGAVGAFVICQRLLARYCGNGKESRVLEFFSQHNMEVYLVHQQIIYFTIGCFNGHVMPVALVTFNFMAALIGSSVFAILMSKTKVTKFLIGSK